MEQGPTPSVVKSARVPWNKGKLVGAKPPLRPSHVWPIRTKLQIEGKKRDFAPTEGSLGPLMQAMECPLLLLK